MGRGHQLVGVWLECPASAKIKTAKISSEESGPFSTKICTSENCPLYGILCNGLALHAIYVLCSHLYSFIFYTSQDHTKTNNSHKSGEDEEREEEETEEEEAEKLQKEREWDEFKDGESNTYDFMASRQCSTVAKC